MTEEPDLVDAEPRRRSGLGSSPLGRVMPVARMTVVDAIEAYDAWVGEHGAERRVVERKPATVRVPEPEQVVEVTAPEPDPVVEATPPAEVRSPSQEEELAGPLSTSDLLARLKAMKLG